MNTDRLSYRRANRRERLVASVLPSEPLVLTRPIILDRRFRKKLGRMLVDRKAITGIGLFL